MVLGRAAHDRRLQTLHLTKIDVTPLEIGAFSLCFCLIFEPASLCNLVDRRFRLVFLA